MGCIVTKTWFHFLQKSFIHWSMWRCYSCLYVHLIYLLWEKIWYVKRINRWESLSDFLRRNSGTWVISHDSLEIKTKEIACTFSDIGQIEYTVYYICLVTFGDVCSTICDVSYYPTTILHQWFSGCQTNWKGLDLCNLELRVWKKF